MTRELLVSEVLMVLGVPCHLRGFVYLKDAVLLLLDQPLLLYKLTSDLYPMVAEKFETTPAKVERAMRHAIQDIWLKNTVANIKKVLGPAHISAEKSMTVGEFISTLAERLSHQLTDEAS